MNHVAIVRMKDGYPLQVQIVAEYAVHHIMADPTIDGYVLPITPHWTAQVIHPSAAADLDTRPHD